MNGALTVKEMFYSLQGEGGRAGEPSIFIRLAGCSAAASCKAHGVTCDTDWKGGVRFTHTSLLAGVLALSRSCKWIVWTGGEPLDQLDAAAVEFFRQFGFLQAVETSGIRPLPAPFDWVTVSPKVDDSVLEANFHEHDGIDELRYVVRHGDSIPVPPVPARHYYLSPHANVDPLMQDGRLLFMQALTEHGWVNNLDWAIKLCLENPRWKLSTQQHKLWGVR